MSERMRVADATKATAVKRLKMSKRDSTGDDFRKGIQDGERWAVNLATYRQLQAVEDVAEEFWDRSGNRTDEDAGHDLAWAVALRLQLRSDEAATPAAMKAILFPGPERRRSPAYVSGFVLGTHGIWQEVNKPAKSKKAAV